MSLFSIKVSLSYGTVPAQPLYVSDDRWRAMLAHAQQHVDGRIDR